MQSPFQNTLIEYIQKELDVESEAIALALKTVQFPSQLPVSLWLYGLISLDGVNQVWNWIDARSELECLPEGAVSSSTLFKSEEAWKCP